MKIFTLIIALYFCSIIHSYTQDNSIIYPDESKSTRKNLIKINYLALPFKTINLSYERLLSNYLSIQIQGYYLFGSIREFDYKVSDWYNFTPEIRIYIKGNASRGFFIAPYYQLNQNYNENERSSTRWGYLFNANVVGLCTGYQWIKWKNFNIDLYGGAGIQFWTTNKPSWDPPVSGTDPAFRFGSTIGYAF
ncbi:MAG: DUF3575 domain-containing protein [Bacteroidia bacterium]|nr:DUF3575 domain-containing protein [Bacteroidia bacterium]